MQMKVAAIYSSQYFSSSIRSSRHESFVSLSIEASSGLFSNGVTVINQSSDTGACKFIERNRFLQSRRLILLDERNDTPKVVCVQKSRKLFVVYSKRNPIGDGEGHIEEKGVLLYPWFEVKDETSGFCSINRWNGSRFEPYLWAERNLNGDDVESPDVLITTEDDKVQASLTVVKQARSSTCQLSIAKRVRNPSMLVCIGVILREMVDFLEA